MREQRELAKTGNWMAERQCLGKTRVMCKRRGNLTSVKVKVAKA